MASSTVTGPPPPSRTLGHTEVLVGFDNGKYPQGNSVLVHGPDRRILIDPSLSLWHRDPPADVDQVILTHVHEDHVAGLSRYPDTPVAVRHPDAPHLHSIAALLAMYGMDPAVHADFAASLERDYHFVGRPDVEPLPDDAVLDLGGGVTCTAIPTPGHTGGHTAWLIEPDGVLVIGDIDLSSFGPYYADAVSSLDDFVDTLARVREIEAHWYVTFHHKGVVEGHAAFVEALDAFASVIDRRDAAMLEFLAEPRTIDDMVAHRFLYRPGVELLWADTAERRTSEQHIARLLRTGQVEATADARYRAI